MSAKIDAADIPAEIRKQLGIKRRTGKRGMTMHTVRTYAIRVLAVMPELEQGQRARILRHALRVNDV